MLASQNNATESPGTHLARSRPGFRIVACIVTKVVAPQYAYNDQVDRAGFVPRLPALSTCSTAGLPRLSALMP